MKNYCLPVFMLVTALLFAHSSAFSEVVIVANKTVGETSLSKEEIKNIFLGDKTKWPNNKMINFVIHESGPIHIEFLRTYIRRSQQQYKTTMKQRVFLGKGHFPKTFKSDKELIDYIAATENAIGYVEKSSVNDSIIEIDIK